MAALLRRIGAAADRRIGLWLVDLGHLGSPVNQSASKQKCCIANDAVHNRVGAAPSILDQAPSRQKCTVLTMYMLHGYYAECA
jgi:hypothetical protein